jgi:hypothetical protein
MENTSESASGDRTEISIAWKEAHTMGCVGIREQRPRGQRTGRDRGWRLRPTVMVLESRALLSTVTVSNTNDSGSGSLRAAVSQANADGGGDTIVFSSLFNTTQTITLTGGQLELTGSTGTTTIQGPGANLLVVSGNNATRVFEIGANATASISGLTITGGQAGSAAGGGLYNAGTLDLAACTVSGDSAAGGGGVYNKGTLDLTACTVSGSTAGAGGGGLYSQGGTATMTLTSCTVSGNTANIGGGLDSAFGALTLTNCTVSGNITQDSVGTALTNAGGTLTLTNTIVEGNTGGAGDFEGPYLGGNNLIGGEALLAPLGDYGGPTQTMALLPGNPAIGMGITADDPATGKPITTDQRGFSLDSPAPDIGAFQTKLLAVNSTIDGAGSPPGVLTLRQAVNLAEAQGGAEAITFDPTDFATRQTITLDGTQIELKSVATVTGPGAGQLTVSGNNVSRVFEIDANATASISGLTITGGYSSGISAGVSNGGKLDLTDCTVSGNFVGVYNQGGTATLSGCTVSGNSGSGVYNQGGTVTLTDCAVSGNYGGGVQSHAGTATLTGCTVSGNSHVGGVSNQGGTVTLTGCTVSGNSGLYGGGLYTQGYTSTMTLTNCTVSGNSAKGAGGLSLGHGALTLINCTVSGNHAAEGGSDLYIYRLGTATLTDTIVTGVVGTFTGHNNLIGVDPLLAPLGDYGGPTQTMALLPGSPAIGMGITADDPATGKPITTDQRGFGLASPAPDIGAFQHQGFILTLGSGSTPQSAALGLAFANPLAVTVTAINPVEPVDGGVVTVAAPSAGASAVLSAATAVIAGGQASVTARTAGAVGSYTVTASSAGAAAAVSFALTNKPGPSTIAVVSGSGQTATVATGFAARLVAVVKDAYGNPVPGVSVAFAPPASGASTTVAGSPAVTGADGQARVTATAGTVAGSYIVTAAAANATTAAAFTLTNTGAPQDLVAQPVDAVAGQSFTNVEMATLTDPDSGAGPSDFDAGIDWGDGITTLNTTVIADGQGRFDVLGTHTYVDAGTYTFRVQVTDSNGAVANAAGTTTVTKNTEAPSLVLTTTRDVVDQFDNLTSLREPIAYANSHPGPDTITFDPAVFGKAPRTIVLTGGPLVLTDPATTTIIGPGSKRLTISGGGKRQVFDIRGGSVALSGVTITGGSADLGGAVRNRGGTLVLKDLVIRGNRALVGGGLFNSGRITVSGVTIKNNSALIGGNLFNTSRATFHWQRLPAARQARARVSIAS